jgi:hypothetical protein
MGHTYAAAGDDPPQRGGSPTPLRMRHPALLFL